MGYYKFLESQHVDRVLKGSLVLSKLSYFRMMEAKHRVAGIGDMGEGHYGYTVKHAELKNTDQDTEILGKLEKAGIVVRNANVTISNYRFSNYVDCYIFSMSIGSVHKLRKVMCSGQGGIGYNAAIRVRDLKELTNAIFSQGVFRPFYDEQNLRQVSNEFNKIEKGSVVYKSNTLEINDISFGLISPQFIKRPSFRPQSEYRITLLPCPDHFPDRIIIDIPNPERFFSKVFSSRVSPHLTNNQERRSLEQLLIEIKSIELHVGMSDNLSILKLITRDIISICWEARQLGYRNTKVEMMILEEDIVYGGGITYQKVADIVNTLRRGLYDYLRESVTFIN